ncbi:SDR family oxidoreductase [Haloferula sargassicola]|uniref:3-oxoacyl-[acyl-carrier-protein] reductase FabG n=1 Tax=Haloferula sargassicola TaxID=490096 RepID=A0ABP9ULP5_9BACT
MDRVCITGGHGTLGRALADAFRAAGDRVSAPGRDELDVTDMGSVTSFFSSHDGFDLLILNAGAAENVLLARCDVESWDRPMQVNLHGAFRCAQAAARSMLESRRGHLVFISSHAADHPSAGQAAYGASKAGLHGLVRSLALELGPANIRANAVLPGFLDTRMTDDVSDSRRGSVLRDHALGRLNTCESVARFIVHLHHHLPHTSGQLFQLDSRPG